MSVIDHHSHSHGPSHDTYDQQASSTSLYINNQQQTSGGMTTVDFNDNDRVATNGVEMHYSHSSRPLGLGNALSVSSLKHEVETDVNSLKDFMQVARLTLADPKAKTIVALSTACICWYGTLLVHAWNRNNQALVGFLLLDLFNTACVSGELVVVWVSNQVTVFSYSFGFYQANIVYCFSVCVLLLLLVFWNCVECLEHLLLPEHHGVTLAPSLLALVCALLGRVFGLIIVKKYSTAHRSTPETTGGKLKHGLAAVIHATIGSGRVHRAVLLSRSVNSNALISLLSWAMLFASSSLSSADNMHWVDPMTSASISTISLGGMWPTMLYHARVLLQTVPTNSSLWFKCLREVSNYDGILEIRNQHLWLNGYNERIASLHVRIRRDANEQVILAQLSMAFSHLCDNMTIQIKKDDWISSGPGYQNYTKMPNPTPNFGLGFTPNSVVPVSDNSSASGVNARQRIPQYLVGSINSSSVNLAQSNSSTGGLAPSMHHAPPSMSGSMPDTQPALYNQQHATSQVEPLQKIPVYGSASSFR
eukprot:CFRG3931T1